jgi:hypothetical protein
LIEHPNCPWRAGARGGLAASRMRAAIPSPLGAAARCRHQLRQAATPLRRTARSHVCCACRTTAGIAQDGVRAARSSRFRQPSVAFRAQRHRGQSGHARSSSALGTPTRAAWARAARRTAKSLRSIDFVPTRNHGMAERTMAPTVPR